MEILEFTNSVVFNSVFTVYVHLTVLLAPLFAIASLTRN